MLRRIAACAAALILGSICAQAADGDGPLLLPEIVVTSSAQLARAAEPAEDADKKPAPAETVARALSAPQVDAVANTSPASQTAIAIEAEPFGLDAEPVVTGEILSKWGGVEAQIQAESRLLAGCRGGLWCPRSARRFLAIINEGRARKGRARIGVINREINLAIVPTSDLAQWGVADRWSPPLETFSTRRGDCEDYAIAKYVALSAAGIAQQDIRLVVVRNNVAKEHHAVVAVRLDGAWVILDNRWLALVSDHELWRATPLFELDDNGVRRFVDPAPTAAVRHSRSGAS